MSDKKSKTIRMTDEGYDMVKAKAKERNLSIGDYIVEACLNKPWEISPDIMCRLHTLGALKEVPLDKWNESLKRLYDDCLEGLCVLLKL